MTFAHVVSGPIDAVIELGLPVAIFLGLYWWSSRKERRKKQ
ncbi:hypothetical protein BH18CHL2_BH18CHL2_09000 [soil metagenome]